MSRLSRRERVDRLARMEPRRSLPTKGIAALSLLIQALVQHDGERFSALHGKSANLHLLWIACGTEDRLITSNRKFIAWLKSEDVPVSAIEIPGMHTWMIWRDNLAHFAPLSFQGK